MKTKMIIILMFLGVALVLSSCAEKTNESDTGDLVDIENKSIETQAQNSDENKDDEEASSIEQDIMEVTSYQVDISEEYLQDFCPNYPNSENVNVSVLLESEDEKIFAIRLESKDSIEDVLEFYSKNKNVTATHKKDIDDYLIALGSRGDKIRGTISISEPIRSSVSKGYKTFVIKKITVKK